MSFASARMIVFLPLGAVEAHGPHLPLDTDTRIAVELARRCVRALEPTPSRVAEPITATAASYARDFPGTVHTDPAVETRTIVETVRLLHAEGAERVVLVNLHFDPEHMRAIRDALAQLAEKAPIFPNFTRRAHAQEIGGEFATGACHGGEFETSLMLVAAPELVGPEHRALAEVHVDLASAIREGKSSFQDVGMAQAYCGHPATASVKEGERIYNALVRIVLREVA